MILISFAKFNEKLMRIKEWESLFCAIKLKKSLAADKKRG